MHLIEWQRHALINPESTPEDFHKPGHLFPLIENGVLERTGHTEALDLAKLTKALRQVLYVRSWNEMGQCDCAQLESAMKYINEHGGMIIYLPQKEEA